MPHNKKLSLKDARKQLHSMYVNGILNKDFQLFKK